MAASVAVAAMLGLAGCDSLGPNRVPGDNFDYNAAIVQSGREQMLLNLVRLRYLETPLFLKVSSVLTQYTFEGSLGVGGTQGFGSSLPGSTITGDANAGYSERPTVTYLPISGQEFARQLMSPIPTELFFGVAQAGWPTDLLMEIGLQRVGDVENMSFGAIPAPGDIDRERQFLEDFEKLERFQRLMRTLVTLSDDNLIEVSRGKGKDAETRYFVFHSEANAADRKRLQALKKELGLDPKRDVFRITERYTRRQPDELTVQPRSLLAIMSFLARGTEIPAAHQKEGRVIQIGVATASGVKPPAIPFRIHSAQERPENAHTAVRYQGYWFYIDRSDTRSKRVMLTLAVLFSLQAPDVEAAAPALTLPTGP